LHENSLLLYPSPSFLLFTLRLILHPFVWWHPFITSLPSSLLDIVDAPVPLLIGTRQNLETSVPSVDLDTFESRGVERGMTVFIEIKVAMERKWAERDIFGMQQVFRERFLSEITKRSKTFSKVIRGEIAEGNK
jgi:DENN (AEX-3) domain